MEPSPSRIWIAYSNFCDDDVTDFSCCVYHDDVVEFAGAARLTVKNGPIYRDSSSFRNGGA